MTMSPRDRDRTVAGALLLLGALSAAVIYLSAPSVEEDAEVSDMVHSRVYERQVEVIGGKAAVFTSELNQSIASLFEGKRLAIPVLAAGVVLSGAYLLFRRLSRGEDDLTSGSPGS